MSSKANSCVAAGQSASSAAGAGRYPKLPLHWAAEKGEAKVVETLISFGARVNAKGGIHGKAKGKAIGVSMYFRICYWSCLPCCCGWLMVMTDTSTDRIMVEVIYNTGVE